jgi:hypothetical protein
VPKIRFYPSEGTEAVFQFCRWNFRVVRTMNTDSEIFDSFLRMMLASNWSNFWYKIKEITTTIRNFSFIMSIDRKCVWACACITMDWHPLPAYIMLLFNVMNVSGINLLVIAWWRIPSISSASMLTFLLPGDCLTINSLLQLLTLTNCPAYNISAWTTQKTPLLCCCFQLLPCKHACLRKCSQ